MLFKYWPFVADFIRMEVCNDNSTCLWSDLWMPQGRLVGVVGKNGTQQLGIRRFEKIFEVVNANAWSFRRCRQPALYGSDCPHQGTSASKSGCWGG